VYLFAVFRGLSALTHHILVKRFDQLHSVEASLEHAREAARNLPLFSEPRLLYAYLLFDMQLREEALRQFELTLGLSAPGSTLGWNTDFACGSGLEMFCLQ